MNNITRRAADDVSLRDSRWRMTDAKHLSRSKTDSYANRPLPRPPSSIAASAARRPTSTTSSNASPVTIQLVIGSNDQAASPPPLPLPLPPPPPPPSSPAVSRDSAQADTAPLLNPSSSSSSTSPVRNDERPAPYEPACCDDPATCFCGICCKPRACMECLCSIATCGVYCCFCHSETGICAGKKTRCCFITLVIAVMCASMLLNVFLFFFASYDFFSAHAHANDSSRLFVLVLNLTAPVPDGAIPMGNYTVDGTCVPRVWGLRPPCVG